MWRVVVSAMVRQTGLMALSKKLLGDGERVIVHTRTHWTRVFVPILVFFGICVATGAGLGMGIPRLPPEYQQWGTIAVLLIALLLFLIFVVAPFVRWYSTTYTITNRRLITRSGIFTIRGHDLPLVRINNVTYERSFLDRILGCGSLTMTTAADEPLTLDDIPHVEQVHLTMTELLFSDHEGRDRRADN